MFSWRWARGAVLRPTNVLLARAAADLLATLPGASPAVAVVVAKLRQQRAVAPDDAALVLKGLAEVRATRVPRVLAAGRRRLSGARPDPAPFLRHQDSGLHSLSAFAF